MFPEWEQGDQGLLGPLCQPLSLDEVTSALLKTKTSSAPGPDGISPALVKEIFGTPPMKVFLTRFFNRCFETCAVPKEWTLFEMFVLYKGKGPVDEGDSYRAISLTDILSKVYE
jgi:hypothetical protein